MTALNNPAAFFTEARSVTHALSQAQVDVITTLIEDAAARHWCIGWVAYLLATAYHEARFTPQDEIGKGKGRAYSKPGKHGGQVAYGRGLVQLTWDTNYEWADAALGLNGALLKDYTLANRTDIATKIILIGMETGHFTGVGLKRYINGVGTLAQFTAARKIINRLDKAELIASYAVHFQDALGKGGYHA